MKRDTALLVGGLLALALSLGGAVAWAYPQTASAAQRSTVAAPAQSATTVIMEGLVFKPATLTVPVGATVTWVNRDAAPHNVVAQNKAFASSVLGRDAAWSRTFTQPGAYSYVCTLHPGMVARVTVTDSEGNVPTPPTVDAPPAPGQGNHCGGLTDDEMRKQMDSMHGQGSYDQMHQGANGAMGPGAHDAHHGASGTGAGNMMGGSGGMGGMMGR
ncbi:MAG: cupredoxin family copper-binding protein [Dehalococcoidia bacterium]|nr:cupredoxin family copper-binding protein [Dehalococcoidia bacterium]